MLIVDSSCLCEVVARGTLRHEVRAVLQSDDDLAAPHVIDVEVLNVIRRDYLLGLLDRSAAELALEELRDWPGQRFGHRALLDRAWELRHNVRGWDAFYVALAEALGGTLITLDGRLGRAGGIRCPVQVIAPATGSNGT